MRRAREQPRLALAKALVAIGLVLAGVALGVATKHGGDDDRVRATEVRLVSAQRSAAAHASELRTVIAQSEQRAAALRDTRTRIRVLTDSNRRLRQDLRAAKRAQHHAPRQP